MLDIETGPSLDAMLCAEPRPATELPPAALHRLTAAVVLSFDDAPEGPRSLSMVTVADMREQEMVVGVDRALPDQAEGNRLITFNGRAWDMPMLMQRAAAAWCFSVPRISAWTNADAARHVDMMRVAGPRGGRGWSSLADRSAAIGVDLRLARGRQARTAAAVRRRCRADVAATFVLFAATEAVRRSDARYLGNAWIALSELVRSEPTLSRDLGYFAGHPVLDGCRVLAGGQPAYTAARMTGAAA